MKRKVAQWIAGGLLITISILLYLFLFQTHLFSNIVLNSLNKYVVSESGISIQGRLKGGLLRKSIGMESMRIELSENHDPLFNAASISIIGWEWDWTLRELTLQRLLVDDYTLHTENSSRNTERGSASSSPISTIIQEIRAESGEVSFLRGDSTHTVIIPELHSTLWFIDGFLDSKIHSAIAIAPNMISDTLEVQGLVAVDAEGRLDIQDFGLKTPNQSMDIDLAYSTENIKVNLNGDQIDPSSINNLELPPRLSDLRLSYDLDMQKATDSLLISGSGLAFLNGSQIPFELHRLASAPDGDQIDLTIGTDLESARIIAHRTADGHETINVNLFRFDMSPFIDNPAIQLYEPIGNISLRGYQGSYVADIIIESFEFNGLQFDTFESDFTYSPEHGINIFTALITQEHNWLNFDGKLSQDIIEINGMLDFSDFSFLDAFGITNKLSGNISSSFQVNGNPDNPRLTGQIFPNNFSYDSKLTLSGQGKVELATIDGAIRGDVALMGESGFLFGDSLNSYTILGNITENGYTVEDLHLQGANNLVSISGGYDYNHLYLNKLNMINGDNQLKLADTLLIERSPSGVFDIPTSILSFNNGGFSVQGDYSNEMGLNLQAAFEIIDLERILQFLRLKVDFAGIASGTAEITGNLQDPIIDAKFSLKRGITLGYPSDSASVDLKLTNSQVYSNNIDAFSAGGSLNLVGRLPWGYRVIGEDIRVTPQNFAITTENYRLKDLKFTNIAGIPVSGRATGSLTIRGTPVDTKMDIQLSLSDASFDTLKFSKAYSELSYEGNLLNFDTLSMVSNWGYGSGTGFMPISLDLIAEDRMAAASRDMGLDFEFNLNEMPFLSSYIGAIDAIEGDFIGNLGFTGPLSAPIRNGKIRGHNGRLEISVLGNPITDIHAEVTLLDNTLSIDHFSGEMTFSEGSNLNTQGLVGLLAENVGDLIGVNATETYAGDITATGTMDMSTFFKPRFDIDLKADEIYYRSTDGLIEAIADAELQFSGQDTLEVEAVIPVLRAGYYANFESQTSYDETVSSTDSSLFKYSLNTQFASDLLISNDQMEAEFEGELWLLDYGDGVMRFSGNLKVLQGGKFYYLGNELDLMSGEIIFNSVDFNPQLNMVAEVDIGEDRVTLELSGDLSEPELSISFIDSENNQLTQSDVLTYLTLNKTMVEVSFDESALDPVRSYSELLVEKQLSKLGREYIGLDLVGVDLASDSTANARFRLGQRLSKNLMVTYEGAIQSSEDETDYDFGFEYQINKNVSINSKVNQNGEVELNGRLKFTY